MALSRVTLVGNGSTNTFTVVFALGYLSEDHITCQVDQEIDGAGRPMYRPITFLSDTLLRVGGAVPRNGAVVDFKRTVPKSGLIVDYANGDNLNEENLETANKHAMMIAHEALDGRLVEVTEDIDFRGRFAPINVRNPVLGGDATNKQWVETQLKAASEKTLLIFVEKDPRST